MNEFWPIFKSLLWPGSSRKFVIGVVLGMAFSISIILSTIGIMDGYDHTIRKGLKFSQGDLVISSHDGFFRFE